MSIKLRVLATLSLLTCATAVAQTIEPAGLITLDRARRYVLDLSIVGSREPTPADRRPSLGVIDAVVSVPLLGQSASHASTAAHARATQFFNDWFLFPADYEILEDSTPGVYRVEFGFPFEKLRVDGARAVNDRAESSLVRTLVTLNSFDTKYDEQAAAGIGWPASLPIEFAPYCVPDRYIPSDHPAVVDLLARWNSGGNASRSPAFLAKHLAAQMIRSYRPDEDFLAEWPTQDRSRGKRSSPCDPASVPAHAEFLTGYSLPAVAMPVDGRTSVTFRGFDVADTPAHPQDRCFSPRILEPIETGHANDAVLCNLYTALLRAAGIPARVVFGVTIDESRLLEEPYKFFPGEPFFGVDHREYDQIGPYYFVNPKPRVWVEFFLYDDSINRGDWIPVDLARQMRESSAPPPLDRPWRYFGNNDELHLTVPVSAGYALDPDASPDWLPALWAWETDPPLPFLVDGSVRVRVQSPRVRSSNWVLTPGGVASPPRP